MTGRTLFVVFDTCTQPEYYRDVHRLLSLPAGTVLRYDYKRYLFSREASDYLSNVKQADMPLDVILFYGQRADYVRDTPPPQNSPMLSWARDLFVPTRAARIVNVAIVPGAKPPEDVIHFHLELSGFVDPQEPTIKHLIPALEALNHLPFGDRATQHCWISIAPDTYQDQPIDQRKLVSDDLLPWSSVISALVNLNSQFKNDIFWRVLDVSPDNSQNPTPLGLVDRESNTFGDVDLWHRDFVLLDHLPYRIRIQTYSPDSHGAPVPGNAALSTIDDTDALLKLPANPAQLRPNVTAAIRFSLSRLTSLESKTASLQLETQVPSDNPSRWPVGSLCQLSFQITKDPTRTYFSILAIVLTPIFAYLAVAFRDVPQAAMPFAVLSGAAGLLAYYLWKGEVKI